VLAIEPPARHRLRRKKAHPQDAFVQPLPIELPRQGRDFYWTQSTALYRREKLAKKFPHVRSKRIAGGDALVCFILRMPAVPPSHSRRLLLPAHSLSAGDVDLHWLIGNGLESVVARDLAAHLAHHPSQIGRKLP